MLKITFLPLSFEIKTTTFFNNVILCWPLSNFFLNNLCSLETWYFMALVLFAGYLKNAEIAVDALSIWLVLFPLCKNSFIDNQFV